MEIVSNPLLTPQKTLALFFRRKTNIKDTSDEQLIVLYKDTEDTMYIGELFDRYTQLSFLVCMKYLKDEEESKDAVMQVFERLINDVKKYEIKQFRFWLHTVVKNHCLAVLEKKNRIPMGSNEFLHNIGDEDGQKGPKMVEDEPTEWTEEQLQQLEKAITFLNDEQKTCIELFYLQQKSYVEVAEITGFDLKQVKSFIQNGKRNLKIHLTKMNF